MNTIKKYVISLMSAQLFFASFNCVGAVEIKLTPEEEKALVQSMKGSTERLESEDWMSNMMSDATKKGCYMDKDTLVNEGSVVDIEGVTMICVSWDEGLSYDHFWCMS